MSRDAAPRLSRMFGRRVRDTDGRPIGRVHEVQLRRMEASEPSTAPAFKIEALIVGAGGLALRLGFTSTPARAPWPFGARARAAVREARVVPWESVRQSGEELHTTLALSELETVEA